MNSWKPAIGFSCFFALGVLLGCGGGGGGGPTKDAGKDKSPAPKVGEKPKTFVVTAKAWAEERKKDSEAFETKYKGRTIEVTGLVLEPVSSISGGVDPRAFWVEGIPGDPDTKFKCITDSADPWWNKVLPGQTVKAQGKCQVMNLFPAKILEATGPKPPMLTVDELVKDPKGVRQKYLDKPVIVTGEIAKVESTIEEDHITLKTSEKAPSVVCFAPKSARHSQLKSGEKVRVLIGGIMLRNFENKIALMGPVIMK